MNEPYQPQPDRTGYPQHQQQPQQQQPHQQQPQQQQPMQCSRCGYYLLQAHDRGGAWVDQHNNPGCPGTNLPHVPTWPTATGTNAGAEKSRKGLIVGTTIAAVLAVGAVSTILIVNNTDTGTDAAAAQQAPSPPAPPPPPPSPEPVPGAPVPCDPDLPQGGACFPPEIDGNKVLDAVEQRQKWPCFNKGEEDARKQKVTEVVRMCQATNNVDQPYTQMVTIGYDTDTHDEKGALQTFNLSATTAAREAKGQTTTLDNTYTLGSTLVGIAASYIWQDQKEVQAEAEEVFGQVQEVCKQGGGTFNDSKKAMKSGIEVSCTEASPITVKGDDGAVVSITQTIRIAAPLMIDGGP